MNNSRPSLSVILLAPYGLPEIRETLYALRRQTIVSELEILVPIRGEIELLPTEETDIFFNFSTFQCDPMNISGDAKAQAVRRAKADVVAFAEDHCYPESGWAEALVQAHQGRWGAVAARLIPANSSIISQASFDNAFGPWSAGERRECHNIPTHNTSYKKTLLLDYGKELGELLDMEAAFLAPDLIRRGFPLLLEPAARVHHINVETPRAFIIEQFLGGRHYGGLRAENWSTPRRLLYGFGSPLIPVLRVFRALSSGMLGHRATQLLFICFGITVSALGEMAGYFFGLGKTPEIRFEMEYKRGRFTKRLYSAEEVLQRAKSEN